MVGYLNARKKSLVLLQLNVPDFAGMSGWKVGLGVGKVKEAGEGWEEEWWLECKVILKNKIKILILCSCIKHRQKLILPIGSFQHSKILNPCSKGHLRVRDNTMESSCILPRHKLRKTLASIEINN